MQILGGAIKSRLHTGTGTDPVGGVFTDTDGGPTVAGTNPAVVAVFARALMLRIHSFSIHAQAPIVIPGEIGSPIGIPFFC